jgi:hypothetical protein
MSAGTDVSLQQEQPFRKTHGSALGLAAFVPALGPCRIHKGVCRLAQLSVPGITRRTAQASVGGLVGRRGERGQV